MANLTIKNNVKASATVRYTGGKGEVTFNPGINFGVPESEFKLFKDHPIFKLWVEYGKIEILDRLPRSAEKKVTDDDGNLLATFNVSDNKRGIQDPMPQLPAKFGSNSLKPVRIKGSNLELEKFAELNIRQAIKQVDNMNNKEGLFMLQQYEKRKTVINAIEKRLLDLNVNPRVK